MRWSLGCTGSRLSLCAVPGKARAQVRVFPASGLGFLILFLTLQRSRGRGRKSQQLHGLKRHFLSRSLSGVLCGGGIMTTLLSRPSWDPCEGHSVWRPAGLAGGCRAHRGDPGTWAVVQDASRPPLTCSEESNSPGHTSDHLLLF